MEAMIIHSKGQHPTLTSSSSSCFPSAGFSCGSVPEGFFVPDFFFFFDLDCTAKSAGVLTSFKGEASCSWTHCWLIGEEQSEILAVSISSTGVAGGIWKLKAKVEPCPVNNIRLVVSSVQPDGDVFSWGAGELLVQKLNLKELSLRVQRDFSALPSTDVELFDFFSMSVELRVTTYRS